MDDKLTFIIKCTRNCNFACDYCCDRRRSSEALDFQSIARLTKDSATTSGLSRVTYIFHGGEPLLLGVEYFRKILTLQNVMRPGRGLFRNFVQTNGSLIDEKWCEFFKTYGVNVGVSLDGPIDDADGHRRYPDGRSTLADVKRGLAHLNEKNLAFGILSVVTADTLVHDRRRLFKSYMENKIRHFAFLAERPKKLTFEDVEHARAFFECRRDHAQFLCEMYRLWLDENNEEISIRELSTIMDTLLGGAPHLCSDSGPCVGRLFGVNVSGDLAHCDKFFADPRFRFGNLKELRLEDVLASEPLRKARELETAIRDECRPCEWFGICKGGCLYEAILFRKSKLKDRVSYCHLRIVYEYVSRNLDSIFNWRPPPDEDPAFV